MELPTFGVQIQRQGERRMRNRPGIYGRVMCPPYTAEDAEFLAERNKVLEEAVNGLAAENFELRRITGISKRVTGI